MNLKTAQCNNINIFMKYHMLLLASLLSAAMCAHASGARILVSEDAIAPEITAAQELQKGLQKIFSEDFPIVRGEAEGPAIRIGQSPETAKLLGGLDFSTLKDDEIILKTVGDTLILVGARPRGTLYAVYELLEREYGVRFWTARAESWPEKRGEFTLPQIDHRYAPQFKVRDAFYDLIQAHPEFAVKMRHNGNFAAIPGKLGGHVTLWGWCHTSFLLIPPKKFFAEHPEYFAERGGQRIADGQLCLSNPEVRKVLSEAVLAALRAQPGTRIISVSQNDNQLFCRCAACESFVKGHGNQSDLLIDAVNHVAWEVANEFPETKVETLAYQYTRKPPQTVRPADNVIVRLCSIECDFSAPLDSEANEEFADELRAWGKTARELYIWNYVTNFVKYYLPHPNWNGLSPDLRFFAENGVTAVFEQGSDGPGPIADLADLRAWLTAKLLWDPSQDADALAKEFIEGYYGPAAPEMLRYFEVMKSSIEPGSKLGCFNTRIFWMDDSQIDKLRAIMETAKAKVSESPELLKRVEEAAVSINLAYLENMKIPPAPDWKEVLERQLEVSRNAETKTFSENLAFGNYETTRNRISRWFSAGEGTPPAVAEGRSWLAVPARSATFVRPGEWTFADVDPKAEGGKALRMPNTHYEWASQLPDLPNGEYDVYIEIRCDGDAPEGNAATAGIYDTRGGKSVEVSIPAKGIAGKEYKTVKIGSMELSPDKMLYCAPAINESVGGIWINRYVLVENPRQ